MFSIVNTTEHYTIPRNNRELQQVEINNAVVLDYTIPRNNRELQQREREEAEKEDYTIPRNNRELQLSPYSTKF